MFHPLRRCFPILLFLLCLSCDDGADPHDVAADIAADIVADIADDIADVAVDIAIDDAVDVAIDLVEGDLAPDVPEVVEPTGPFRIAVITDSHFTGNPEHPNNVAFHEAGSLFSSMSPQVDLVVNTGDNVEDLLVFPWELEGLTEIPILISYRDAIDQSYSPDYYITMGNHDNRFFDTFQPDQTPLDYWVETFKDTESLPATWYFIDHRGFRLVFVDCTDEAFDHESNDTCTLSTEQLDWLDETLTTDLPVLLFWHIEIVIDEGTELDHPLLEAIYPHKERVRGVFMGHSHRFRKRLWYDIPFLTTDSLKDQTEPIYHLIECDPDAETMTVVNEADIDYGSDSVTEESAR